MIFAIFISADDNRINRLFEKAEIIVIFGTQFGFNPFPKPLDKIKIGAISWYINEFNTKQSRRILHDVTFLITCVVEYQTNWFTRILQSDIAEKFTYFRKSYICIICDSRHFLGNEIQRAQNIVRNCAKIS